MGNWSEEELDFLKENYHKLDNKEILKKVNHSFGALTAKAKSLYLNKEFKTCKKCNKEYKIKPKDTGSWLCLKCRKTYFKEYGKKRRRKNKKYYEDYFKKYRTENKIVLKKKKAEDHQKNKKRNNKKGREYYQKHKEEIKTYQNKYYLENNEKVLKRNRKYNKENFLRFRERNSERAKERLKIKNEIENKRRKKLGIPLIGQRWVGETTMKIYLDKIFPNEESSDNKRGRWLKGLEIDRYYPNLKIGFEYNGKQHYEPVKFGWATWKQAKERFKKQIKTDLRKKKLCLKAGITLITIRYDEKLSKQLILNKLKEKGIKGLS